MAENIDLNSIFQTVTQQLSQKKDDLNQADTYNHDHGDHMVQIFELAQNAVAKKSDEPASDQLEYASKVVQEKAQNGSAKLYAQGLSSAAKNLSGKDLNQETVRLLIKGLMNVEEPASQSQPQENTEGLIGSLLSGLTGEPSQEEPDQQQIGLDELLNAGLSFYQSKQEGDSNTEAIMDALMAASPMGQSEYRSQSGSLVAQTIMGFVKNIGK